MPINQMESDIHLSEAALVAAKDSDISLSSSNPNQHVGFGVKFEKNGKMKEVGEACKIGLMWHIYVHYIVNSEK